MVQFSMKSPKPDFTSGNSSSLCLPLSPAVGNFSSSVPRLNPLSSYTRKASFPARPCLLPTSPVAVELASCVLPYGLQLLELSRMNTPVLCPKKPQTKPAGLQLLLAPDPFILVQPREGAPFPTLLLAGKTNGARRPQEYPSANTTGLGAPKDKN